MTVLNEMDIKVNELIDIFRKREYKEWKQEGNDYVITIKKVKPNKH